MPADTQAMSSAPISRTEQVTRDMHEGEDVLANVLRPTPAAVSSGSAASKRAGSVTPRDGDRVPVRDPLWLVLLSVFAGRAQFHELDEFVHTSIKLLTLLGCQVLVGLARDLSSEALLAMLNAAGWAGAGRHAGDEFSAYVAARKSN